MSNSRFAKRLMPAVTLDGVEPALRLAETYLEAGLDVMEITFRTDTAEDAIRAIAREFPAMSIGAGTLLSTDQVEKAIDAGAQFGLSPGFNPPVAEAALKRDLLFIPGVATPSEIEEALSFGCRLQKLFPVNHLGGVGYIRSLEGPYGHTGLQLIPMSGVNPENLAGYLASPLVAAAGGSWIAPAKLISEGRFSEIRELVKRSIEAAASVR